MRRLFSITVFALSCAALPAHAQAPATGPLLLRVPATPRTAALGNAWVAGRDQDVLFYNPAQLIGARTGFDLSLIRFGSDGTTTTLGSVYAAGKLSLTLGWGVQVASYRVDPAAAHPYQPDVLTGSGDASGLSALGSVGGAVLYKGFRIGAAGKYAVDRVSIAPDPTLPPTSVFLADVGVARNVLGGVAAFSAQNLGRRTLAPEPDDDDDDEDSGGRGEEDDDDDVDVPPTIPRQMLMGWSMTRVAGPLDLGIYTQVLVRSGWTSPGAGLDVTWSWIEGCFVSLRAGARRPETTTERPYSFGGAVTIDRATVEYSVQFFDEGHHAHGVTFRWR